jgi:ATP-dependent DNA helicase RecG
MYPELACREALINAIAHRDYSAEGRGIEIYVFDDRMEVRSPGSLLSSLTVDDLRRLEGAHQSRNSLVARVLREMGYVREIGEGMRRIFELMESNELAEPDIASTPQTFIVTLSNKPVYRAEHLLWLENFSRFTLNREQKAIIVLGYGGGLISANDIWNTLGLQDTEEYRKLIASLQFLAILKTEVNKREANKIRHLRKVNSRDIPRFRIQIPTETHSNISSKTPETSNLNRADRSPGLPAIRPKRARSLYRGRPERFDAEARVYIGNLSMETQPSALLEFFTKRDFDPDVEIPQSFGRGKGYAFAQFNTPVQAKKAMETCNGEEFQGRRLVLRPAVRRFLAKL